MALDLGEFEVVCVASTQQLSSLVRRICEIPRRVEGATLLLSDLSFDNVPSISAQCSAVKTIDDTVLAEAFRQFVVSVFDVATMHGGFVVCFFQCGMRCGYKAIIIICGFGSWYIFCSRCTVGMLPRPRAAMRSRLALPACAVMLQKFN